VGGGEEVEVPSLLPAGCQSFHRESVGGAGPREESRAPMSRGTSITLSADTAMTASSVLANVERIFKTELVSALTRIKIT
jgi:hypothetical protein